MDISLHLHDPDELKAFARFCNDMADVRVKQRAEKPRDFSTGPAEPLVRAFERADNLLADDATKLSDLGFKRYGSLEEARRAIGAPEPAPLPVTAAAVDTLRKETGASMMEAKSALTRAGGNAEQARALLLPPPHDSLEEAQRAAAVNASMLHTPAQDPYLAGFAARSSADAVAPTVAEVFGMTMAAQPTGTLTVGATSPAVPLPPSSAPSTAAVGQFLTAPAAPPAGLPPASFSPVPPSAPSVAAPTAAGTTSPAGGVDLDADGLPWDHRIHSGSKEKNKDGRWRSKRGLNDEGLVKRIEAELRATMAIPVPPSAPAVPSVPIPAPPTAIPLPPPAAAATSDPTDFASLIAVLTPRLTPDRMPQIFAIVQSFGLPGLPALQQRPDLVPAVWAKLKEHLG